MFKINLVPEAKKQQKKLQQTNLMVTGVAISVAAILLITILVFLAIRVSKSTSSKNLSKNITKTESELKNYKSLEETVISLQKGLNGIEEIDKNSYQWSEFLKELEETTPKDISFEKIDIKGNLIEADLIGKDIDSLARFVESFKANKVDDKNLFKNIDVSGYKKDDKGNIKFSAKIELVKEVLWP